MMLMSMNQLCRQTNQTKGIASKLLILLLCVLSAESVDSSHHESTIALKEEIEDGIESKFNENDVKRISTRHLSNFEDSSGERTLTFFRNRFFPFRTRFGFGFGGIPLFGGNRIFDNFFFPGGLRFRGSRFFNPGFFDAVIFDATNPTGEGNFIGTRNTVNLGNVLIVNKDNNFTDPDTDKSGGIIEGLFTVEVTLRAFRAVNVLTHGGYIEVYGGNSTNVNGTEAITDEEDIEYILLQNKTLPFTGKGRSRFVWFQQQPGVLKFRVVGTGSFAIDDVLFLGPEMVEE